MDRARRAPARVERPRRRHVPEPPLPDQWELYDLDADPIEAENRWNDPAVASVFAHLQDVMKQERADAVPERNHPWPYASRRQLHARR